MQRQYDLKRGVIQTIPHKKGRQSERGKSRSTDAQVLLDGSQDPVALYNFDRRAKNSSGLPRSFDVKGVKYRRVEKLGEGAFSVCYLFRDTEGRVMAGKIFSRSRTCSRKRLERFEREIEVMKKLDHPNIVQYIGAVSGVHRDQKLANFTHDETIPFVHPPIMFLDYCAGGSLSGFMKERLDRRRFPNQRYGQLTVRETLWVAESTARALKYIHNENIVHRDLKMGNLLLQSRIRWSQHLDVNQVGIVLCDFGLATQLRTPESFASGRVGTPNYMAPELLSRTTGAVCASDIWSLGVTLFHCLTGRAPFNGSNSSGTYRRIREGAYRWTSTERENLPRPIRHFVDSMLKKDVNDRPTASECLQTIKELRE